MIAERDRERQLVAEIPVHLPALEREPTGTTPLSSRSWVGHNATVVYQARGLLSAAARVHYTGVYGGGPYSIGTDVVTSYATLNEVDLQLNGIRSPR